MNFSTMNHSIESEAQDTIGVNPMDLLFKPVSFAVEETPSFAVQPVQPLIQEEEEEEDSDFDDMSDVESDYEVNYVRHESRVHYEDEDEDDSMTETEDLSQYTHRCPQVLPPPSPIEEIVVQQGGKSLKLVRRHYDQVMTIAELERYRFRLRGHTFDTDEESLSPATTYVYTEEIGPSDTDTDYPSSSLSPDVRDDDDEYIEDDTSSHVSQDTLVDDSLAIWFHQKEAEMFDTQIFH